MQEMDPASSSKLSESDIVTNIQQESDRLQTKIGDERKYHVVKYFTVFLKASENDSFSFDGSTSGLPVLIDYKHCLCSVLHLHESWVGHSTLYESLDFTLRTWSNAFAAVVKHRGDT